MRQEFVAYSRSSTPGQTIGLEIQRNDIERYVQRAGGEIISWYTDVGTASATLKRLLKDQPNLTTALADARKVKATLIAARLDRLTRSCAVLSSILENGPALLIAGTPTASPFVLQVYAAVAEEFRRKTSRRCKAGIAAAIARGARDPAKARATGRRIAQLSRKAAQEHAERLRPIMEDIRRGKPTTAEDVAQQLNEKGYRTVRGNRWTSHSVFTAWARLHRRWHTRQFPRGEGGPARLAATGRARNIGYQPLIESCRAAGASTIADMAQHLNANGIRTRHGRVWTADNTRRVLNQIKRWSDQ